jgi:hypothetical protein
VAAGGRIRLNRQGSPAIPLGDGFWEVRNLNDTLAVVGFFLTLGSIWYAWWLARKDLRRRIDEARRETVSRPAAALLQSDVSETFRLLEQAREACRLKNWSRAIDRSEQAMRRIPKFRPLPGLTEDDRRRLDEAVDTLRLMVRYSELVLDPDKKPVGLSAEKTNQLDNLIDLVAGIEGRMRASGLEQGHGDG